jgi:hypothetical protein
MVIVAIAAGGGFPGRLASENHDGADGLAQSL